MIDKISNISIVTSLTECVFESIPSVKTLLLSFSIWMVFT